jgi:hypothetical protein
MATQAASAGQIGQVTLVANTATRSASTRRHFLFASLHPPFKRRHPGARILWLKKRDQIFDDHLSCGKLDTLSFEPRVARDFPQLHRLYVEPHQTGVLDIPGEHNLQYDFSHSRRVSGPLGYLCLEYDRREYRRQPGMLHPSRHAQPFIVTNG